MTPLFLAYALACGAVLVALWWSGNAAILDAGDYTQPSVAAELRDPPPDKVEHLIAGALLTAIGASLNHWWLAAPVLLALALGALWEAAQWYPRRAYGPTKRTGFFDVRDFLAVALGALGVAVIVLGVQGIVLILVGGAR